MEQQYYLYIAIPCIIAFLFFIGFILHVIFKEKRIAKGVSNTDIFSQHYYFKLPMTKDEMLKRLKAYTDDDVLRYDPSKHEIVLTFTKGLSTVRFTLETVERDGCYLRLSRSSFLSGGNAKINTVINRIMKERLDALPLSRDEYQDVFN